MERNGVTVELLKYPTQEDWLWAKQCALVTVGLHAKTPPRFSWMEDSLEARHSYIRELRFGFYLSNVPYYVAMHLVRHHVGCQPYVRTQRNDRQSGYDRTAARQDAPVDMIWSMNAESLMTIANKRLCNKAAPETKSIVEMMCDEVDKKCIEFRKQLVPMCDYYGGVCHEMNSCGRVGNEY